MDLHDLRRRRVHPLCTLALAAALALGLAPAGARAQVEDPGLEPGPAAPPPPSRPTRPRPATALPPTSPTNPPPPLMPMMTLGTAGESPVKEDVQEEVSTSPSATLTDDQWEASLAAPTVTGPVGLFRI